MKEFREELLYNPHAKSLQDVIASITPPEGFRMAGNRNYNGEGSELFDCDGCVEEEDYDFCEGLNEDDRYVMGGLIKGA